MFEKYIQCTDCKRTYTLDSFVFRCETCGGSLDVVYDYDKLSGMGLAGRMKSRPFGHSRYLEFYPVPSIISMGEGGTPLVKSTRLGQNLNFNLYFKNETQNPTGSFKDRGSSVELAKLVQFFQMNIRNTYGKRIKRDTKGRAVAACASTGNMGASLASYSVPAGVNCTIFTPHDTPALKLQQILAYGARVYKTGGDYTKTAEMVYDAFKKYGTYLLGDYLYRREGTKSVGFEVADQLGSILVMDEDKFASPDYIFCPVGNGTLLSAVWKAFLEFKELGILRGVPKIVGVQAAGCSPVVKAFDLDSDIKPCAAKTVASSVECGDPLDGKRALESVRESEGFMVAVPDKQILEAREILARQEGIFTEPGGAVALAGLLHSGVPSGANVVCLVTGHGLKTPYTDVKGKVEKLGTGPMALKKVFSG